MRHKIKMEILMRRELEENLGKKSWNNVGEGLSFRYMGDFEYYPKGLPFKIVFKISHS